MATARRPAERIPRRALRLPEWRARRPALSVLREQIIPYLGQVKTAMVQGFSYEILQNTQNEVVGVNISLDGISGKISVVGGSYQVQLQDPKTARYDTYPDLGAPEDVSEASLGNLLKALIDQK